jgi:hypothetical protein
MDLSNQVLPLVRNQNNNFLVQMVSIISEIAEMVRVGSFSF